MSSAIALKEALINATIAVAKRANFLLKSITFSTVKVFIQILCAKLKADLNVFLSHVQIILLFLTHHVVQFDLG